MIFSNSQSLSLPVETNERLLHVCWQFAAIAPSAVVVPIVGGFSGAGVWRIEDRGQRYALRRWPTAGPELPRLEGLHRLLRQLWALGRHEVCVPIMSASGHSVIFDGGNLWQLELWMPGNADFHADPNSERLQIAMQSLAHWHAAARLFAPTASERPWFEIRMAPPVGLSERFSKLLHWESGPVSVVGRILSQTTPSMQVPPELDQIYDLIRRVIRTVSNRLRPLVVEPVWQQPCLRDIWHDHLLFDGNQLTGLIDPGACRTDHITADLSRLLGSLLEDDRDLWTIALDHYQSIQPLTIHDWRLLQAYDQSGVIVSGITWLEWLVLPGRTFPDRGLVEQRLGVVLRRLKYLEQRL